jgi:hypothetical protein
VIQVSGEDCKVEPPLSFDVVLFGPLENEISQFNLRVFVQHSPIGETSSIFWFVNCPIFSDLQVATGLHYQPRAKTHKRPREMKDAEN